MEKELLLERLVKCVEGIEEMINSLMMEAMANEKDPYALRSTEGTPLLAPLIIAQTSALMMIGALGGANE